LPSTQLDALVTQHGRDQLHANWPDLFHPDQEAMLPAEELLLLKQGGDYGWPECYYDHYRGGVFIAFHGVGVERWRFCQNCKNDN